MKIFKRFAVVGAIALAIGATSVTAFAAYNYKTPSETLAGVTGKTVEAVNKEKTETGKSYGTIANESGKLTQFKEERLKNRKEILNAKVADGSITRADSDKAIKAMEERQLTCNGEGQGKGMGLGQGKGMCSNIGL